MVYQLEATVRRITFLIPKRMRSRIIVLPSFVVALLAVGLLMTRVSPEKVLIGLAALPAAVLVSNSPEFGVMCIILAAGFVRFSLPTGTASRIVISLLLTAIFLALWIMRMAVVNKRFRLVPLSINIPLLGFVGTCIISLLWSNAFRDQLVVVWDTWTFVQLGGLAVMILLPGALLLTANVLADLKWIKCLTVVMIVIGTIAIIGYFGHLPVHFLQVRPLFPTWFICLAYGQALFNRRLPWPVRAILLVLVGAWFYRVFVEQIRWLSAWLPTVVAMSAISFLRSRKFFLVLAIVLVAYMTVHSAVLATEFEAEQTESGETRLRAWAMNWRVTGQHFLFGVGPAGYAAYYMSYFPSRAMATHSNYIDIISQTGVVGLFFFAWLFFEIGRTGWRLRRRLKGRADFNESFSVAALAGWVGSIVAMALGDWIVPFVYTQTIAGFDYAVYTWVMLGAMLGMYHVTTSRPVTEEAI